DNVNYHIVEMCNEDPSLIEVDENGKKKNDTFSDSTLKAITAQVENLKNGKDVKIVIQGIETVRIMSKLGLENFKGNNGLGNPMLSDDFTEDKLTKFTVFGDYMDLSQTASIKEPSLLWVITLLTFVSTFLSTKLTKKFSYQPPVASGSKDAEMSMKIMDWAMPLMTAMFTFTFPAVIAVYWIYQNVLGVVQQYVLKCMYPFPEFTEEDYKKANKELYKAPTKRLDKAQYKSSGKVAAHRIDLVEEAPAVKENEKTGAPAENDGIIPKAVLKDESDKK
ncbi:MAG: YidC/Oxa1 family membrane protein insertase, partial [Firmicutes bacterium]|nr:YidC/Oxa1 family membrane protein insertase [Candidatus Colimorpha enterica]